MMMETFEINSFLLGMVVWFIIHNSITHLNKKKLYKKNVKIYNDLITQPKDYFSFNMREGIYATINYGTNGNYVLLDLDMKTITILDSKHRIISHNLYVEKEHDLLYENITTFFEKEIFVDIIINKGVIYSKNIIKKKEVEDEDEDEDEDVNRNENIEEREVLSNILSEIFQSTINKETVIESKKEVEDETNRILDKISSHGMGSLTEEEKRFLNR